MPRHIMRRFSRGWVRDAINEPSVLDILHTIENYDLDRVSGGLKKRKGSARWNSNALAAAPQQLHHFIDASQNEKVLVVSNNKLYVIDEDGSGTPTEVLFNGTTSHAMTNEPYPFLNTDRRCFFADDTDWYWVDNTSLGLGTPESYQVGIDKSSFSTIDFVSNAQDGKQLSDNTSITLNDSGNQKRAMEFTVSELIIADGVELKLKRVGLTNGQGNLKVRIETDSSNLPSGTLVGVDYESQWVSVTSISTGSSGDWAFFRFPSNVNFSTGTTYHVTLESDGSYKTSFSSGSDQIEWRADSTVNPNGKSESYNGTVWSEVITHDALYRLGDRLELGDYQYKITAYNSTHGSESIESDFFTLDTSNNAALIQTIDANTDPQVDRYRLYRTKVDDTGNAATYYLVGAFPDATTTIRDTVGDSQLTSQIQTTDHYRLRDDNETEILPLQLELFKNRIWSTVDSEDNFYYSKKLDDEGASGQTGIPIHEAFPTGNKFETRTNGKILRHLRLSIRTDNGQQEALVSYFNNAIGLFTGANTATNPLTDLKFEMIVENTGLIGSQAVTTVKGIHIFLGRSGLYAFDGTPNLVNLSSNRIQSLLNNISDANLALSICRSCSDCLWLIVDEDDDGTLDKAYILDFSLNPPIWRGSYNYNFNINDLLVRQAGNQRNQPLFATDLSDFFIREAETGASDKSVTDTDVSIEGIIRTHKIGEPETPNREFVESAVVRDLYFSGVSIEGKYPNTVVPKYTVTVYDKDDNPTRANLSPTTETDKRGHRTGVRVNTIEADVEIKQSSIYRDEIRSIGIEWR